MQERGERNAWLIARLKSDPELLLTTTLVGNTLSGLGTASYATLLSAERFGSVGVGLATGAVSFVVLMAGEVVPKSLSYANNVRVAQMAAYPLALFHFLLHPLSWFLNHINQVLGRLLGTKQPLHISEEEVLVTSRMSVERGGIGYDEHELIERVFRFDDTSVAAVMTPLPRVESLNADVPVDQIAYHAANVGHSRYPVYRDEEDRIIGYVHTNALMRALNSDGRDRPVSDFMLPVQRLDERMSLERAFRALNRKQSHLALVHEHGKPDNLLGIVTLEDVLEDLVGEIEDETDE